MSDPKTATEALQWAAEKCDEYAEVMEALDLQELRGLACRTAVALRAEADRLEALGAKPSNTCAACKGSQRYTVWDARTETTKEVECRSCRDKLGELRKQIGAQQKVLADLEDRWHDEAERLVGAALETNFNGELVFGGHACKDSPLQRCVYNDDTDRRHDFCLFCGDPEERK